jgi:hypothetical protein
MVTQPCSIGTNSLTITIADDDRAQIEVDTLLSQLNQNLDALRSDFTQHQAELEGAIDQAAANRNREIDS